MHEHTAMYKVADLKFGICLLCGGMNLKGGSDGHVQAQIFPVGSLQTGSAGRQARGWTQVVQGVDPPLIKHFRL